MIGSLLLGGVQLFFFVCAMKCGTTFAPVHVGHVALPLSCSKLVMVNSTGSLCFGRMNGLYPHEAGQAWPPTSRSAVPRDGRPERDRIAPLGRTPRSAEAAAGTRRPAGPTIG